MKYLVYLALGLTIWLNWDKISQMFGKKDDTKNTEDLK